MSNKVILILGRSGSGKDTLLKAITEKYKQIVPLPVYTTRKKRDYDENETYRFVTMDEFNDLYKKKEIFEKLTVGTYLSTNGTAVKEDDKTVICYGTGLLPNEKLTISIASPPIERVNKFIGQFGFHNIAFVYTYCKQEDRIERLLHRYTLEDGTINYQELERREKLESKSFFQEYDRKYISRIKDLSSDYVKLFKKDRFIVVNTNGIEEEKLVFKLYQKLIKLDMI